MKKLLSLLLAAVMILSLAGCGSQGETTTAPAATETTTKAAPETTAPVTTEPETTEPETEAQPPEEPDDGLPRVGQTVEGFTVKEVREFPLVGATLVLFEHDRTGAELMYIANSDTNRVFDLTFFTRAVDNSGLPHVFEHSTLDGSAKYPSKALFFNLSYQTYNTYMNAMTSTLDTTYPVASLSEAQLLKYADYYTDSCFNPMIMEDESIFLEEAWRYRLADKDDELTIEGTVYSEMKGARTLASSAYTNFLRAAFPGSTIGNVSGGEPENIPEMTWEGLRAYHEEYYHPSNCIAYLYGQFEDYSAFLKLLDEAFAPYEKREFNFADDGYQALTESVTTSVAFPVEAGSDTDNSSAMYYAFICPGANADEKEELILNTLTDLMVADGSNLMLTLKRAIPSGKFATYIELDGPEDMIVFYADNVNPKDAGTFRATVDAALKDIAENGFSADLVDGIVASLELSTKLTGESSDIGVDLISTLASYYASTGDPFGYLGYVDAMDMLREWNEQGLYKKAVSDWLLNCDVTVLCSTYPEPGKREELDAAEKARLAEVKAAMSEEELQAIIDFTNREDEDDDASEYVRQLQAVTVSSLPEECRVFEVSDTTGDDKVRYINATAEVDGVGSPILLLDASGLAQEDILWFHLYTDLVGSMSTKKHIRDDLALLSTRYLYDGEIRLSLIDTDTGDGFRPCLRAGWTAADEDLAAGYDLMYEILFETDFSDEENLSGLISKFKASLKSSITSSPYNVMIYRAMGYYSPLYRYYSYFNSFDYYAFLEEAEAMMAEKPADVISKLESIQKYFHNRTNAAMLYAGSTEGIAVNEPLAKAFVAKLDEEEIKSVDYDLPAPARREALIVDSNVQYNGLVADYATMEMDGYTGDLDAVSSILSDSYLYPMLRDQYGAYGVMTGFITDSGAYVVSYRDPNVKETFEVYDGISAFVKDLEMDQDELDGYILSSYAYYAKAEGELSGAKAAAIDALIDEDQELNLTYMKDLKQLSADSINAYADAYEKLCSEGVMFTAGGAAVINENADLYDAILNPFGAVEQPKVEFEDVPEDHENYEAVYAAYEYEFMVPVSETEFGVDEEATYGDLAYALYVIGFGELPSSLEGARDELAEYNIMKTSIAVDEKLTAAMLETSMKTFSMAVGAKYSKDSSAGDTVVTRGQLAQKLWDFLEPYV